MVRQTSKPETCGSITSKTTKFGFSSCQVRGDKGVERADGNAAALEVCANAPVSGGGFRTEIVDAQRRQKRSQTFVVLCGT
jgi:hypothetical protein